MSDHPLSREYEARINHARRLSWICEGIALVSLIFGFICCVTLMRVSSEVRVLSQVIPKDTQSSDDYVLPDAINSKMLSRTELDELFVRRYIMLRHENIRDKEVAEVRVGELGELHFLSFAPVYKQFIKIQGAASPAEALSRFYQNPVSTVEFKRISHRPKTNMWQVEFDKVYPNASGEIEKRVPYTAAVVVGHASSRVRMTSYLANPLGFVVTQYSESIQK